MFKRMFFVLGFLWALPISILWWIVGLFLILLEEIEKFEVDWKDFTFLWDLRNTGWFCSKFFLGRGWGGYSCGNNKIVVDSDTERWKRTIKHETRHCYQQYAFGIFHPIIYIVNSIIIYFFVKEKHSYYDNVFERDARAYVNQPVEIPKSQWKDPTDRWSFW